MLFRSIIGLCLLLFLHGQWFKSYYSRKLLRNFTICVSALVKRYPGGPMLLYDVGQLVHTYLLNVTHRIVVVSWYQHLLY